MKSLSKGLVALGAALVFGPAGAQLPPQDGGLAGSQPTAPNAADGTLKSGAPQKIEDYIDRAHLLKGKDADKARAEAREESGRLLKALQLRCEIADAEPVGRGRATVNGQKKDLRIF